MGKTEISRMKLKDSIVVEAEVLSEWYDLISNGDLEVILDQIAEILQDTEYEKDIVLESDSSDGDYSSEEERIRKRKKKAKYSSSSDEE